MRQETSTTIGKWAIILICLATLAGCGAGESNKKQPSAKNGVLDLTTWDFENDGTVKLDGEWEFYWEQLIQPQDFIENTSVPEVNYFSIPGIWNEHVIDGKKLGGHGYATFRLLIKVEPGKEFFAIKALEMAHAYKMWINSKEGLSNGIVGTSQETMTPQYLSKRSVIRPENGTVELVLQVSNFVHRRGGVWNPFDFGTVDQINEIRERNLIIEFIMFGSILIMGFYHLGLFLLRKKERSTLYFGAFCLLIALRVAVTGERVMHTYFPWFGWEMLVRLEYLAFYLGAPCFFLFLSSLFPQKSQIPIRIIISIALIFSAVTVVTPPRLFTHALPYYQIFSLASAGYMWTIVIRALFRKEEGSFLIFLGSMVLIVTLIHDILLANGLIYSINFSPLGLFTFIFVQSLEISIRFSKAFSVAEILSNELEEKVEHRTQGLRIANEEIELSNRKLQETQSQLFQSQKMEAMGTLAGGIAHDFNNILGTMMGYTELLISDQPTDSQEKKYLEVIYSSGERAVDLVKQILTFSRIRNQDRTPIKIQTYIPEILKMMRATLPESIEISEFINPDCGPILANQTQISQIVVNLCTNGEHAMREKGGNLDIALNEVAIHKGDYIENPDAEGLYLQLSIRDTGVGIADDIRDRIFDPFFSTKEVNEGSGLGLSIIHGIVKNHQGFIKVESELHEGSQFHLFFPVIDELVAGVPRAEIEPKQGKGHILIVEDDRDLSLFYSTTLEKLGYETTVHYNGQEALDYFEAQPESFNLVFSDQVMPKMTGLEMSKEILKIKPDIPIIIASGYNTTLNSDEARKFGIRSFLSKPIKISELTQKIFELI